MAIDVWLTDESGTPLKEIADDTGELARVIALATGELYPLLSGIDPYADTVFNYRQMSRFFTEWDRLAKLPMSSLQIELMERVREFAKTLEDNTHMYLRFVGD